MTDQASSPEGGATQSLAERLHALSRDDAPGSITLSRDEAARVMEVAEKAHALLEGAFAIPADEHGIRLKSEDAVRLHWALRQIGIGDDSGHPCFTV